MQIQEVNYSYETSKTYGYLISPMKMSHFDRAKPTLKLLLASWTFYSFLKGFRSFNAKNLESVGQRAAKWLAIKLWEWFDFAQNRTRADWPTGAGAGWQTFACDLQLWQLLTLKPCYLQKPTLPLWKDLTLVVNILSAQENDRTFKMFFAWSKYPYFTSYREKRPTFI